jgi:phage tail protein X
VATQQYVWAAGDTLAHVASRYMIDASYSDIYSYINDVYALNPSIYDWFALPAGTVVLLPFLSS